MEFKISDKLKVLVKIAKELNNQNILWAVGGSLLLYLNGKTDTFHDLDIMVCENDAVKLKEILLTFGELQPLNPNFRYKTKCFMEFIVDGVDIDVMAGLTIVKDGKTNYFPLAKNNIEKYIEIENEKIPLQSLDDWKLYYKLMNRPDKVKMITTRSL